MKKSLLVVFISLFCASAVFSQCCNNPLLTGGDINPAPLVGDATGSYEFTFLESFANHALADGAVVITISHANIEPTAGAASVSGVGAAFFTWVLDGAGNLVGTQNQDIPALAGGDIVVAYTQTDPMGCVTAGNVMGFDAAITVPACMEPAAGGCNNITDDTESSFTCNSTLPVELAEFTAVLISNKDVHLDWATASEAFNDRFEIQRSFDGIEFETIGQVRGAGTSNIWNQYDYIDDRAYLMGFEEVYYRLKQVDTDGVTDYSQIELISFNGGNEGFQIITHDFGSLYRLKVTGSEGISKVDIYGISGTHIDTRDFIRNDVVDLDVRTLSQGVYVIVVNDKYKRKIIVAQ